jgi:hypothetical protein
MRIGGNFKATATPSAAWLRQILARNVADAFQVPH